MQYSEILVLKKRLEDEKIDFRFGRIHDGFQIYVKGNSIVQHYFSYGNDDNLLEVMGSCSFSQDDAVEGWLSAEELFSRIMSL